MINTGMVWLQKMGVPLCFMAFISIRIMTTITCEGMITVQAGFHTPTAGARNNPLFLLVHMLAPAGTATHVHII